MEREPLVPRGNMYCVSLFAAPGGALFSTSADYLRLYLTIGYYKFLRSTRLSAFLRNRRPGAYDPGMGQRLVELYSYCFMPSGVHLLLRERLRGEAAAFSERLARSYGRYRATLSGRRGEVFGPGRHYAVGEHAEIGLLENLMYSAPVEAGLAGSEGGWPYTSFPELYGGAPPMPRICDAPVKRRPMPGKVGRISNFIFTTRKRSTLTALNPFLPAVP